MRLLEIHTLQNFVPSLLNRDETGAHKDCIFGGKRRARISSQCWKRAIREHFKSSQLLDDENLGLRSRLFHSELEKKIGILGVENASYIAEAILALLGLFHEERTGDNYESRKLTSEYLIFLGQDNLSRLANIVSKNLDTWRHAGDEVRQIRVKDRTKYKSPEKGGSVEKKDDVIKKLEKIISKDVVREVQDVLSASRAVDLALFGRMLADSPQLNVSAACQVAHAISTHEVRRDEDYFSAVDDLQGNDQSGAGMLGHVEFSSACYYRYAALDLKILTDNLKDQELAKQGTIAFVKAFLESRPPAKQNTFAAHNWPGYVMLRYAENGLPCNLANAFECSERKPALSWTDAAVEALEKEWTKVSKVYGLQETPWGCSLSERSQLVKGGTLAATLEQLDKVLSV